jgi:hypothetical protein
MIQRLRVLALLVGAVIGGANSFRGAPQAGQAQSDQDHLLWVGEALKRMQTIKPGMTRQALLAVFTTEGGISTPSRRTFVSRDCPYFKVDVEFQTVDRDRRATTVEDSRDIIVKISRPYLQFAVVD